MKNAIIFALIIMASLHANAQGFALHQALFDTIKPITQWDTEGFTVTTFDKKFSDPEGQGMIILKKGRRDTLLEYDPAAGAWVPTNKIIVPRTSSRFLRQPMFEKRPKGPRKTTADVLMVVAIVGYFITGYHAGASERSLSQSGWPRTKSAYNFRDASIWGDCGFGLTLGISTGLNWNQELHWKTLARTGIASALCFGSRYAGTRVGYFEED